MMVTSADDSSTVYGSTQPQWLANRKFTHLLIPLAIFFISFLPRVIEFGGSTTIWHIRAVEFVAALRNGQWANTLQAPHPGVIVMWLAGMPQMIAELMGIDYPGLPFLYRLSLELIPLTLVISLAIVAAYFLVAQLFDYQIAAVGTVLLALDPYHISLSKAIHVDALMSVFFMLSVLFMWVYFWKNPGWRHLVFSAVFAALGILTKTPAVFLLPFFFLCLAAWFLWAWRAARTGEDSARRWSIVKPLLRRAILAAGLWLLVLVAVYVLLWPSMWVQPLDTLDVTFGGSAYYRDTPHENPTFFLGESLDVDPGPLFYPITTPIKMTAVTLIGFLLSIIVLFQDRIPQKQRLIILMGLALIFFFTVMMTLGAKKFTRYMLPAMQFATILAGVGWVIILRELFKGRVRFMQIVLLLILFVQALVSLPLHPYYGTHYNYLFGGPQVVLGQEIVSGQEKGEGLKLAAEYLNSLSLAPRLAVGAQSWLSFHFYFDGQTLPLSNEEVDYLLFTRSWLSREVESEDWGPIWEAYKNRKPKFVASFGGVPYVWVYKTGPVIENGSIEHPVEARIGEDFNLLGYDFSPVEVRPGELITLNLYWETLQETAADYTVFTHLLDGSDQLVGQKDSQPQAGMYPTFLWSAGERLVDSYEFVVDETAAAGQSHFAIGMYELQTLERLPVFAEQDIPPSERRLLLNGPTILKPE
ncbi:MAG: glycosyltransferase family 39 protein [Candidatus Promineifilaceae bacterium]|nr:glycosyltransferase family 39 protein [Candidatus Promineifilaceae bacterium]